MKIEFLVTQAMQLHFFPTAPYFAWVAKLGSKEGGSSHLRNKQRQTPPRPPPLYLVLLVAYPRLRDLDLDDAVPLSHDESWGGQDKKCTRTHTHTQHTKGGGGGRGKRGLKS